MMVMLSTRSEDIPFWQASWELAVQALARSMWVRRQALVIVVILYGAVIGTALSGQVHTFRGYAAILIFSTTLTIVAALAASWQARRRKHYSLKWYNRWYWYLAACLLVLGLGASLYATRGNVFGFEVYDIPSASMSPTLQPGDTITVDTRYAGPVVGDVVVYRYPMNRQDLFAGRIAATGGQVIEIRHGTVYVDGMPEPALDVNEENRQQPISVTLDETPVSDGEVFMLGDWRDNSNDSRFWGSVPEADIIGKVMEVVEAENPYRVGLRIR